MSTQLYRIVFWNEYDRVWKRDRTATGIFHHRLNICRHYTTPFTFQLMDWIQGYPKMQESPLVITFRMIYYFPFQGFWLTLFSLSHTLEMMHRVCEDGLYSSKQEAKGKGRMWYLADKKFFASFWKSHLKKVFKVPDHPDWKKRSFVFRVWMKVFSSNQALPTTIQVLNLRFTVNMRLNVPT